MNPSDSKKLKEIEKQVGRSWDCSVSNHLVEWLISKVAEQDREIERLKGMVNAAVDQREEMRSFANDHLNKRGEAEDRAEKAGAQLKDAEYRWQRERERGMKAEAEIGRWQRKKWEIEEKYNRLFTEFKRRGKTIIRLDNRNKKVEAELADMIQREASVCPEDVGCDEYIPILQRELSACKERMGQLEEKFNRYGQHLPNCALPEQKCNCGFHEACLEAQEQSKEKENDRIMAR